MNNRKQSTPQSFLISAAISSVAFMALSPTTYAADTTKILTLDSAGLRSMRIEAGGGDLRIDGIASGQQIEVVADIHGYPEDAELSLSKSHDQAVLISKSEGFFPWWSGFDVRVDLKVKVPAGLELDINDGSGDIVLSAVTGRTRIDDGSGSIEINNLRGDLDIDDGSGSIEIDTVVGNVDVEDGSGSMRIANVDGHVTVDDGSGAITIDKVSKGVTILDSGSGGLSTRNISGGVDERR